MKPTEINPTQAREFVELHNSQIQEWHKLSGKSDVDFFLRSTQTQTGEDDDMGELIADRQIGGHLFEISASDSHNGNPILFFMPSPQMED